MDVDATNQWVLMGPVSQSLEEPHIMDLLNTASAKLDSPSSLNYSISKFKTKFFRLKLSSDKEARKFVKKFHGKKLPANDGKKVNVRVMKDQSQLTDKLSGSEWLRISNLNPSVSEKELMEQIRGICKPKFLEFHRHSDQKLPSFAFVQMNSSKDAEKVVKTLRMKEIDGQKVWARKAKQWGSDRNEKLKGEATCVLIRGLPAGMKEHEVEKLCAKHGNVKSVRMANGVPGYAPRSAFVHMSNAREAASVFKELNEKSHKKSTLFTSFWKGPKTDRVFIGWFPKSVTQDEIKAFVQKATKHKPTAVHVKTLEEKKCATVIFDNVLAAGQCLQLSGQRIQGKKVTVTPKMTARPSGKKKGKAVKKKGTSTKLKGNPFTGGKKMKGEKGMKALSNSLKGMKLKGKKKGGKRK